MWDEQKGAHTPVLRWLSLNAMDLCVRQEGSCKSGTGEK